MLSFAATVCPIIAAEERLGTTKSKIAKIEEKSKEIDTKRNANAEVDALNSRWQTIKTASNQWGNKLENLIGSWKSFEALKKEVKDWIEKEDKLDEKDIELVTLEKTLGFLPWLYLPISRIKEPKFLSFLKTIEFLKNSK